MQPGSEQGRNDSHPSDPDSNRLTNQTGVIDYQQYGDMFDAEFCEDGQIKNTAISVMVLEDDPTQKEQIAKALNQSLQQLRKAEIEAPSAHLIYITADSDSMDLRSIVGEDVTTVAKVPYPDGFNPLEGLVEALKPHKISGNFIAIIDQDLVNDSERRPGETIFRSISKQLQKANPQAPSIRAIFATNNRATLKVEPGTYGLNGMMSGATPEILVDKGFRKYLETFHQELKRITGHQADIRDLMKISLYS